MARSSMARILLSPILVSLSVVGSAAVASATVASVTSATTPGGGTGCSEEGTSLIQAARKGQKLAAHTHLTMNIAGQGERRVEREREKHPKTILVSHRSCSEDQSLQCSKGFIAEIKKMAAVAAQYPIINETHLFTRLPDTISSDPRWARHIQPGIRGRCFWFWKPAIINDQYAFEGGCCQ
ncbi:unnamed protein product [Polarella glacialis]|uniref:Uncharacterized protein n=1 Tax=Polarella glacialis TaxID=89957 RepID=A0A813GQ79_POLGL|nr:unnamed protein product [Polarella glacialis]